ncbi:hypothetical protein C8J56DRAFT_1076241 [Mycena floridula]|nr:hypothetical protein C8J56DRAFT_1076241 [Mycena floridula]
MTDWTSPETVAHEHDSFVKLVHCIMGVFAWEWLISLDFDLLFLLGQRKLKWPLFFYFYGRYASLGNLIGVLIVMDIGHPVHCQAAYISIGILGNTAICVATINLSIRTMVVWAYDTRIMATLIVLTLGHFTVITLNLFSGQVDAIATRNGCVVTDLDPKLNAAMFIYTSGIDLIVMCLMAFKVFRYRQDKISTLLLRDGLIYFLVVFVVNVVAAIFSLLNLNPLMSVIADAPASMFATIAAGRAALTDAVSADGAVCFTLSPYAMEPFPTEIWQEIIQLACTDDGYTGLSLSLVSSHMSRVARRYRLRTVYLSNATKIVAFALFLAQDKRAHNVCCLFITSSNPKLSRIELEGTTELLSILQGSFVNLDYQVIENTISYILENVASTLQTLHIHLVGFERSSVLPCVHLPHLVDLSIYGPFDSSPSCKEPPTFPALRKLRLEHRHTQPNQLLPRLMSLLPSLTHLRLPGKSFNLHDLIEALGGDCEARPPRFPLHFEHMIIEVDCPEQRTGHKKQRAKVYAGAVRRIQNSRLAVVLVHQTRWISLQAAKEYWMQGNWTPTNEPCC